MSDPATPRYLPWERHVSSSRAGWVNYTGGQPKPEAVFTDFPKAVIVNGQDDWYAGVHLRPEGLKGKLGVDIIAWYHTGTSGISKSGFVCTEEEYTQFAKAYEAAFCTPPTTHLTVLRWAGTPGGDKDG
jgi:hypothetical protein